MSESHQPLQNGVSLLYFGRGLHPTSIGFVEQPMQDYIILDCHTETTLTMETLVLWELLHRTLPLKTALLHWTLLSSCKQEFDDKENDPIPVDDLGIYSELDSTPPILLVELH